MDSGSLITFTMQMAFVVIGGEVVASSAAGAAPSIRGLAGAAANWDRSGRARRRRFHDRLAAQLGVQPRSRRPAGPARWRRGGELRMGTLSPQRRGAAGPDFRLGATWAMGLSSSAGAAAGQCSQHTQGPADDHRGDPIPTETDLHVAIVRGHRGAARGLHHHRDLVGARTECRRDGRGDGDRNLARRRHHGAAAAKAGRMARAFAAADRLLRHCSAPAGCSTNSPARVRSWRSRTSIPTISSSSWPACCCIGGRSDFWRRSPSRCRRPLAC